MITYKIIEELRRKTKGLRVCILYYADDGMFLSNTREEAEECMRVVKEVGEKYGLMMNEQKTKCIIFNGIDEIQDIEGIEVFSELKYLGIKVQNIRNVYGNH